MCSKFPAKFRNIPIMQQTLQQTIFWFNVANLVMESITAISSDSRPPKFEMLDINNCF